VLYRDEIKDLSFLGRKSMGNEPPALFQTEVSDKQRAVANLVLKGGKDRDQFIKSCQRYAAHRRLLCRHHDDFSDTYLRMMEKIQTVLPKLRSIVAVDNTYATLLAELEAPEHLYKKVFESAPSGL
jgi:hypothetical protein